MPYLLRRLKSIVKHLQSLRGLLLVVAGLAALGSLLTEGLTAEILTLVALAGLGALLLLISLRQADDHSKISRIAKHQKKLDKRVSKAATAPAPIQTSRRVGPNPETLRKQRVEQARQAILQVRGDLATSGPARTPSQIRQIPAADFEEGEPAVTVVVPCYNESQFLAATLESVRRQSFTNWECVIVDDASTDHSLAEAHRYVKADDRFRLVRHKVNGGLSAARNTGLRLAKGRFITFLDSDDMLMADSLLDRLETLAETDDTTAGAYCGIRIAPEDQSLDSLPARENWGGGVYVDFVSTAGECPFNAHAPLLRTEVVRAAGGFDESMLVGAEDWNLWMRIMRRGYNFKPSQWRTAIYRQKHQSMAKVGAGDHVEVAQRQIALSYAEDSSVGGPGGFPLALPAYQQQLTTTKRALQYAATAFARGDTATAQTILEDRNVVIAPWMDNHYPFEAATTDGFRRAYGLGLDEIADLEEELAPLRSQFEQIIQRNVVAAHKPHLDREGPRFDFLFVPHNGAQAKAMLAGAASLAGAHSVAFLDVDRVSGPQGAGDILSAGKFPVFNMNQWVLGNATHRDLIVSFPRDGIVEEFIAATLGNGGRVAEVVPDGVDVLLVDERPDYGHKLDQVEAATIEAWLAATDQSARPDVALRSWNDVSEPDPDAAFLIEEYPDTFFDAEDIQRFKNIHKGERCVIIGNGPSLNKLDLRKLASEYTIGVNGIFYAAEQMGFDLTYYLVEDTMVMRDNVNEIKAYRAGHKFFPSIYRNQVGEADNVTYFMMNRGFYAATSPAFCIPRFSTDASQRLYSGQSVTLINLQLAYYMGFEEIVLIGMDFSYTVPEDSKVDGAHILSMGDDPNHFHPDYFGKGKIWKDPKLDRVLANYQLAKLMYEADERRIINATAGGKLELFDRIPYNELFG